MRSLTSEQLAIGLVFIAMAALACLSPVKSDTWWLLRSGLDTIATLQVPLHDTYTHTARGAFWPNHEWLTGLLFYGLYRAGGMPALVAGCALLSVSAWVLSWRMMRGPFELRLVLFVSCIAAAAGGFAIRPQVFTVAAFALSCWLLSTKREWWLPPILLVWANLHGAVALGLIAVAGAIGAALFWNRRRLPSLLLAATASAAATLVSPLGWRLWTFIPESMQRSAINQLSEWQRPGLTLDLVPFWICAVILPVVVLWRWRRLDERAATLAAIALATLPLALLAIRNVHVFLLAAMPALSSALERRDAPPPRPPRGERGGVNALVFNAAMVVGAIVVVGAWLRPTPAMGWSPMSDAARARIASCPDRLYNTYADGGELIWFVSEKEVFIDNRQDPFSPEVLRDNKRLELDGDFGQVFKKYGIRCAVVPMDTPLDRSLGATAGWQLIHDEPRWRVYVER